MSSIIRARSGLMGWWEASEVSRGSSLELKVAGPSMLGIGCPDRHALPLATSPTRRQRFTHPPPAGAGSFFAPLRHAFDAYFRHHGLPRVIFRAYYATETSAGTTRWTLGAGCGG